MKEREIVFFLPFIMLFIVCIFIAWVVIYKAKHRERLVLMEKQNPEEFLKRDKGFTFPWTKLGIVIIGIGVGIAALGSFQGIAGPLRVALMWIIIGSSFILANYLDKDKS